MEILGYTGSRGALLPAVAEEGLKLFAQMLGRDRAAFEGRRGGERSTDCGSTAKTVASLPWIDHSMRARTAKKEIPGQLNVLRALEAESSRPLCLEQITSD